MTGEVSTLALGPPFLEIISWLCNRTKKSCKLMLNSHSFFSLTRVSLCSLKAWRIVYII